MLLALGPKGKGKAVADPEGATGHAPIYHREVFQRTLLNEFSQLFWNPFIIYLSQSAIKQSHSSIYAASVDLNESTNE